MAWYEQSFGQDYLIVYKHRDFQGAFQEVKQMIDWIDLPKGARILDLCCGMGRHSLALAGLGYHVTGVDLSEVLLTEAKLSDTSSQVEWIRGDMRNVPLNERYDAVVNLFTSFGYFDTDEENALVLKEMDRLLIPQGKFAMDFLNPAYIEKNLVPQSARIENLLHIEETRSIEAGFVKKTIVLKETGREERVYSEQVKLYHLEQFKVMFAETSLQIDAVYGHYDGQPYDTALSPRMIMVGHKVDPATQPQNFVEGITP
ncbi:MAG TPA: methyltransferase domain-containing protein [Bacilli bacterium]